jgi:peptidoglycan/xylan/chitin deacetylase (PgdA/CDA1 family)
MRDLMSNSNHALSVPVLMYHHVTPQGGSLNCSVKNFESQMRFLAKHGYTSLTAEQFAGFLKGETVPKKSVVLTFDDGYLNNYEYAHPILEKYGMHALMFVITQYLHDGPTRATMLNGANLKYSPSHQECKKLIAQDRANEVMLRWDEVRAMQKAGTFEFHSHTHTHNRWDLQEDNSNKNDKFRDDLLQSQIELKQHLGTVSDHFCWPQGYFDDDYIAIAKELGFNNLYTTDAYGLNQAHSPADHIYRIAVRNRPSLWLWQRLWLATHPYLGPIYNQNKLKKRQKREQKHLIQSR